VLTWVWVAVVVLALIIMGTAVMSVLGRLSELDRAARKLQARQAEAMKLQEGAAVLERSVLAVQERAELMQERVESIQAGLGKGDR
jgi:heme exporter protein D